MATKYLISRTDNMGDVILTLPLAGLLKEKTPGCEVWFLARDYVKEIVNCANNVDGFISWDDLQKQNKREAAKQIQQQAFDVFINVDAKKNTAKLAKSAKIPHRIGTSHRLYHWFTCNKLVNFSRKKAALHEIQLNTKLLKPLGFKDNFSISELASYLAFRTKPIEKINQWLNTNRFNLVLHPGSNGNTREWPISHWLGLINALPKDSFHILITGTAKEKERFKSLCEIKQPNVTNLMGECTLPELTALLSQCDGMVVGSTGPLHLAAALGTRTLGLFPPFQTANPSRWGPVGKKAEYFVSQDDCKATCQNQHCACMEAIGINRVLARILAWKKEKPSAPKPSHHTPMPT